jgi:glycosyltransferase involved in cell wall biosynthesis
MGKHLTEASLPEVSVVIPNYNHSKHLVETINSFLEQSYPPVEIIVVDDASTDGSWQLLQGLAADHGILKILRLDANAGVNRALAKGIEIACAPFLVPASADDVRLPDFLQDSARMLAAHPKAALVFSDPAELIDATGEVRAYPNFVGEKAEYFTPDEFADMQRRRSFRISSNTTMFRRQMFDEIGGFRPEHHWHADWLAITRLGMTHGVCYLPKVLCYFRIVEGSYSTESFKKNNRRSEIIGECLNSIYMSGDQDLISRFKKSAVMPEHELFMLPKLVSYTSFRRHCTLTMLGWMVIRQLWTIARPIAPRNLRRLLRRIANSR